jgi:hypothetical protein
LAVVNVELEICRVERLLRTQSRELLNDLGEFRLNESGGFRRIEKRRAAGVEYPRQTRGCVGHFPRRRVNERELLEEAGEK